MSNESCPVIKVKAGASSGETDADKVNNNWFNWSNLINSTISEKSTPVDSETKESQCPIDHSKLKYNDVANDLIFDQSKGQNQKINLSVNRSMSNIPKSDFTPTHQPRGELEKWVYPSGLYTYSLFSYLLFYFNY